MSRCSKRWKLCSTYVKRISCWLALCHVGHGANGRSPTLPPTDNLLTGTLPEKWASVLKEMDIVLAGNAGLRGAVPQSWLALSTEPGWGHNGRMLDFNGCSGLEQRAFSVLLEYSLLRVGSQHHRVA